VSDPYRSGTGLTCPRCNEPLVLAESSFICARDCGEWVELGAMRALYPKGAIGTPDTSGRFDVPCAMCQESMDARWWGSAPFELCALHGLWIDTHYRTLFHEMVAEAFAMERKITALAELFADPAGHRELAIRLITAERRLEVLEALVERLSSTTTEM
jgi:hypothetical protein